MYYSLGRVAVQLSRPRDYKKMNNKECDKCDERGMISDGGGFAHSCECGFHNRLMDEKFAGVSIEELLAYGAGRIEEKKRQTQNYE